MKTQLTIALTLMMITAQATGTFSLIEINPQQGAEAFIWTDSSKSVYGAGELSGFTDFNGRLFFSARDVYDNDELWSTDGTQSGLSLVKEINPNGNAYIGNLVNMGNKLLFMASDNGIDFDLWSSDGTSNGTKKVSDLNQMWNGALVSRNIAVLGNRLVFCSETHLMVTDGTTAGTFALMPIALYTQGFGYCNLNNKVYFVLPKSSGGNEVWRTDGTASGTEKVVDVTTAPYHIASITEMVSFNGKIYINAAKSGKGNNLFMFDGNINGQIDMIDITSGGSSYPGQFMLHNGALFFTVSTMTSANVFRITTNSHTPQELMPNSSISWLNGVTLANQSLYFLTDNQQDLHRIDLNTLVHQVTHLNGFSMPYYIFSGSGMLTGNNGRVYFAAYDSTNQQFFFESDEALTDISMVMPVATNTTHPFNYILSCGMADVFDFMMWGNKVIVPANFNDAGRELWIYQSGKISGLDAVKNQSNFTVFPNPVQRELFVETNGNSYCQSELLVTDMKGQKVVNAHFAGNNTSVNLELLSAGNYFVTVVENGVVIGTRKIAIAK